MRWFKHMTASGNDEKLSRLAEWRRVTYWLSAAVLTFVVTW